VVVDHLSRQDVAAAIEQQDICKMQFFAKCKNSFFLPNDCHPMDNGGMQVPDDVCNPSAPTIKGGMVE
jgi:hypothetical protein